MTDMELLKSSNKRSVQVCVFASFVCVCGSLIVANISDQGILRTNLLMVAVVCLAAYLIENSAKQLNDKKIKYLFYFFSIKLLCNFFLLKFGWLPTLFESAFNNGYDPARFYWGAEQLANVGFDTDKLSFGLNYTGILFYYGILFKLFGQNPVVPVLINNLVTLCVSLYLLNFAYKVTRFPKNTDWLLGLVFFFPEVIWFDILSSRETLTMSLMCFSIIPFLFLISKNIKFKQRHLMLSLFSIFLLAIVRPPMAMVSVLTISTIIYFAPRTYVKYYFGLPACVVLAFIILLLPFLANYTGGYELNFKKAFASRFIKSSLSERVLEKHNEGWSENSIGKKLIPESLSQVVLFAPLKVTVYFIAPLPHVNVNFNKMIAGVYSHWQRLFQLVSSLFYLLLFPFVLSATYEGYKKRRRDWYPFLISFWALMCAISLAVLIIQPRYRIVMIPFFCACVWLGRTCPSRIITKAYIIWGVFLFLGAGGAILCKMGIV